MHRWWVLAFVLGCGGSRAAAPPPTTEAKPAAGPSCARAADHVVELMTQLAKDAPPEKVAHFKDEFVKHCDGDKWSVEMQTCVVDAKRQEDFEKCDSFLTPAQKQALAGADGDEEPDAQPPPPPPHAGASGGAAPKGVMPGGAAPAPADKKSRAPKKGGDPQEGGE
jgi:hypothetical protein